MRGFVIFIGMGKKFKVILTEQELANLFTSQMLGGSGQNPNDFTSYLSSFLKGIDKKQDTSSSNTPTPSTSNTAGLSTSGTFTPLDLNSSQGYNAYKTIADNFIAKRPSNILGITGDMLAKIQAVKDKYPKA